MSWQHEEDEHGLHEGFVVALVDGCEPAPVNGNYSWSLYYDGKDGRPLATALRAGCECGWRGQGTSRIDWGLEDPEDNTGWGSDTGPYSEWSRHAETALSHALPHDVTELLSTLEKKLDALATDRPLAALHTVSRLEKMTDPAAIKAAVAARGQPHTWEAIGAALGSTKQAASQRFARHLPR